MSESRRGAAWSTVRAVLWFLLILSCVLMLLLTLLLRDTQRALIRAGAALERVVRAEEAARLGAVRGLRTEVDRLERNLRWLNDGTAWLARPLSGLEQWPALAAWATLIDSGLGAASALGGVAREALGAAEGSLGEGEPTPFFQVTLVALGEQRAELLRARGMLEAIDAEAEVLRRWRPYLELAPLAVDGLLMAPRLLVGDGEGRTILVLLQNSDELRATGGFISSAAVLHLHQGQPAELRYLNSYDVEAYGAVHPPAPAPLRRYMGASILLFRDGNWSPDFPTSAEVLAVLFEMDEGTSVDAVLAMDSFLARLMLSALGPLSLPDYDVTVTEANLEETVAAFWERPLEGPALGERSGSGKAWLAHRKDVGAALLAAGLERLQRLSSRDLPGLLRAARRGVRGKHLLCWALEDAVLQEDLARAGLDGAIEETRGDYLMVVDSNLGWNKVDRNIVRRYRYGVRRGEGGLWAELRLTYRNVADVDREECLHRAVYGDSYAELAQRCYWNYVRVLTPVGTLLESVEGTDHPVDVSVESGKASFGTLLVVPPRQERSLVLTYQLPSKVLQGERYELLVQKQPGAERVEVEVIVEPSLGEGWHDRGGHGLGRSQPLEADVRYSLPWWEGLER